MNALDQLASRFAPLAGRVLLALIFVISGYGKISGFAQTAGFMASKGMPIPEILLVGAIVVELGGGILLILGWQARLAALALFLFMIPATLVFHAFWTVDAAQMQNQFIHFFKNLCIMGGMLYIMAFGSGPYSLQREKS